MSSYEEEDEDAFLERAFSQPRIEPSFVLESVSGGSEERQRLTELWTRYWKSWETDSLPEGVWWDKDTIRSLLSERVMLLKPEGAFQGRDVVIDEYDNFAKRFPASTKMDRRLIKVIVDERRKATTAAFEVIIPDGILAEDDDDSGDDGGGRKGSGAGSSSSRGVRLSIFSVAEVVKWDLRDEKIKEIHYFGSGVRLANSRIKGKLHRARQHRRHVSIAEDQVDESFLEAELGAQALPGLVGCEDVVLDTRGVSDDRPLVQLTLRYIESLLKWDRETVVSLVTESYRHLTAFGDSFGQSLLHFGKAGKVKGEIDSVYCDEDQKVVSIERRYETNDKMTEIIDLVYWEDPGPRIHRHATYGFSWQAAGKDPSLSRAASERKTHSSVHELLDDTSEGFLTRMGSGSDSTRVRSRTHSDGGTDEGEDWGVEGDFRGSFGRSKKNRQGDRKVQFL